MFSRCRAGSANTFSASQFEHKSDCSGCAYHLSAACRSSFSDLSLVHCLETCRSSLRDFRIAHLIATLLSRHVHVAAVSLVHFSATCRSSFRDFRIAHIIATFLSQHLHVATVSLVHLWFVTRSSDLVTVAWRGDQHQIICSTFVLPALHTYTGALLVGHLGRR